ncbi:MAG: hypothetical protein JW741_14140 [Sedimentisphaerales bacterium]|nr:hypothetical protein [Sedimentisphaerales bacterium]
MESRNYLGIYWARDRATVVALAAQGRDRKLLDAFSVSVADEQEPGPSALAERIGRACSERNVKSAAAGVALDCEMFMQHSVRSAFLDEKKIAATVRFDTEEALATDISEVAVAFRVTASDEEGATLDVYTAQRNDLSELLFSLQGHGIDPVTVDPDVYCLSRYLRTYGGGESSERRVLYAFLSDSRGYLVSPAESSQRSLMRAFPVGPAQQRDQLLSREILVTAGLAESVGKVERLCAFDARNEVNVAELGTRTGLRAERCNLAGMAGLVPADWGDCSGPVDVALAYGAALAVPQEKSVNFRTDHMPYQGTKARKRRALKFLSFAVTLLLLAVGVYFHTQLLEIKRDQEALRSKFEPDYLAVMPGEEMLPEKMKTAVNNLDRALRRLRAETTGVGAENSISAKLVRVLQAVNSCAAKTDLNIDSVTITERSILVNADTSSRRNTLSVFDAMKKAGLEVQDHRLSTEGGRDNFSATMEPKKQVAKKEQP